MAILGNTEQGSSSVIKLFSKSIARKKAILEDIHVQIQNKVHCFDEQKKVKERSFSESFSSDRQQHYSKSRSRVIYGGEKLKIYRKYTPALKFKPEYINQVYTSR